MGRPSGTEQQDAIERRADACTGTVDGRHTGVAAWGGADCTSCGAATALPPRAERLGGQ